MLDHSANAGRHALADRGHDLYETPPEAVRALMKAERLPKRIWEPACGPGKLVAELRAAGHDVIASDIVPYPGCYRVDFLRTLAPPRYRCIVTNPPYKIADAFVRHALGLCPKVIMLLRLAFLESVRRTDILEGGALARVHVFRARLPMMHRHGWTGPRAGSSTAFAWFVWDRAHVGPPSLHRVSWQGCSESSYGRTLRRWAMPPGRARD